MLLGRDVLNYYRIVLDGRGSMRERLGVQSDLENESDTLPLADAQLLVARGFKNWDQLVKDVEG